MTKPEQTNANTLNPAQEDLSKLWEEHVRYEFSTHNTDDTLATMVEDAYVNHIPVLTGGVGKDECNIEFAQKIEEFPDEKARMTNFNTIAESPFPLDLIPGAGFQL